MKTISHFGHTKNTSGWARSTTKERFMTSKPQLSTTELQHISSSHVDHVRMSDMQHSSAAPSRRSARSRRAAAAARRSASARWSHAPRSSPRRATSPHRRHERRERREQTALRFLSLLERAEVDSKTDSVITLSDYLKRGRLRARASDPGIRESILISVNITLGVTGRRVRHKSRG